MAKINIKCRSCSATHTVQRTIEIPLDVTALDCNWCPYCEEDALEPYAEYYQVENKPTPRDPAQLKFEL